MHKKYYILVFLFLFFGKSYAQIQATFSTTVNNFCDGIDCDYDGPSILINEIMISPVYEDGSLFENGNDRQGEWIELFNPDICDPVDISCYYLGNNQTDGLSINAGAGFQIPQGTVIPPAGFCVIRGKNAPAVPAANLVQNGGNVVEIVPYGSIVCMEGIRLWFPNAGGWFAFYNENGVPQDAVSWGNQAQIGQVPCVANGPNCNTGVTSLASYNNIPANRKTFIYGAFPDSWGRSMRRVPDGGNWVTSNGDPNPTPGDCNDICIDAGFSSCDGTATVNVTGGTPPYTYLWDDWQAQTTQTAVELCEGTYHVQVTDNSGNTATFSVEIENYVPTVTFVFEEEFCNYNQIAQFTNYSPVPTGEQTGVFTGNGAVDDFFHVNQAGVGTHQLTYTFTDEYGCTNSATTTAIVHPVPQASLSGTEDTYCLTDDIIPLTASPSGGNLFGPGIENNSFNMGVAGPGNHVLNYAVVNQFGCADTAKLYVTVYDIPTFDIEKIDSTCGDNEGEIILVPTGGTAPYNFSIDGGTTFQSNGVFSNLPQGNYSLLIIDANGCSVSANTSLFSFPLPNVDVPDDLDICIGDGVTLTAYNPDNVDISWSNGVIDGVEFFPTTIGLTIYTLTATLDPCTVTEDVKVFVHNLPPVSAGNDMSICFGDTIVLSGYGAIDYVWDNGVINGEPFSPDESAVYEVIGTDIWGCVDTAYIEVIVNPLPEPDFYGDTLYGCQPFYVNFFNTSVDMEGIVSCRWDFGDGFTSYGCDEIVHKYIYDGIFDVSLYLTDENGCTGVYTIEEYIEVFPTPIASFMPDPWITGMSTPVINFINSTIGGDYYTWDFGYNNDKAYTTHATYTYPDDQEGNYTITLIAENDYGCIDSVSHIVQIYEDVIFYVPNTFTPDGDEFNNIFQPIFTQGFDPLDFRLRIYNRWGELIFESKDASIGWDGTYGEVMSPDGTYVWLIEFRNIRKSVREKYQGHVNLLR